MFQQKIFFEWLYHFRRLKKISPKEEPSSNQAYIWETILYLSLVACAALDTQTCSAVFDSMRKVFFIYMICVFVHKNIAQVLYIPSGQTYYAVNNFGFRKSGYWYKTFSLTVREITKGSSIPFCYKNLKQYHMNIYTWINYNHDNITITSDIMINDRA